jgi:hypothetical protein
MSGYRPSKIYIRKNFTLARSISIPVVMRTSVIAGLSLVLERVGNADARKVGSQAPQFRTVR